MNTGSTFERAEMQGIKQRMQGIKQRAAGVR
jgi:hypothetical protein